ncbi:MAG: NAD(P)-binding domain-containing protein [Pseudobdellovibrio sp.]
MNLILNVILNNIVLIIGLIIAAFVVIPIMTRKKQTKVAKKLIEKAVETGMNEPLTLHPEINESLCSGCAACTRVCPEGDILKMVNHKATLVSPTKCVGHGECERACPMEAITLVFGTKTRGMDIPRLSKDYETNVKGLYIAGELGGMGLIRNAIKQGVLATTHALAQLSQMKTDYDLLIVGAGPAGLAAGITAIAQKKSYLCIEQNSFGGTVYNFPRQKIVMTYPIELPITGKKKFQNDKVTKEELLAYWMQIKKSTGLKIEELTKFESLEKKGEIFEIKTNKKTVTAKKVILAMGVRGSPRKLGVQGEDSPKVTYNLLDPEQYQNKNVIVVGGGNAGVEAAQMLGDKKYNAKVHLFVRGATFDRCNEDNQNRIYAMEKNGLVQIWFNTSIQTISDDSVNCKKGEQVVDLPNDYVFVYAGAELPHKFLMSLGVGIDKKFAEGLT